MNFSKEDLAWLKTHCDGKTISTLRVKDFGALAMMDGVPLAIVHHAIAKGHFPVGIPRLMNGDVELLAFIMDIISAGGKDSYPLANFLGRQIRLGKMPDYMLAVIYDHIYVSSADSDSLSRASDYLLSAITAKTTSQALLKNILLWHKSSYIIKYSIINASLFAGLSGEASSGSYANLSHELSIDPNSCRELISEIAELWVESAHKNERYAASQIQSLSRLQLADGS